ncbi:sorting nexin-15 [Syngnathus acus]|uniref:sorting nexin-15 n=1 Tax=Syngnathus acus TaxID=161584 RepID=UPI001885E478|nr:sorting nexin-15 [Syngnathus acus]
MSRKDEEFYRFFSVTDIRTHEKGYTEYKVIGRFVPKPCPEDVKEVVVWTRYSELKKLHAELANTHRNLFRREEEFPAFPTAQRFGRGRFDEAVIEERRKAAEDMLVFCMGIPALYKSPHLIDFFRDGDVTRPQDPSPDSVALPPPLIPLPKRRASDCEPAEEEAGREAPTLPQDLGTNLRIDMGKPEVAAEAYNEMRKGGECAEMDDRVTSAARRCTSQTSQEEIESLLDVAAEVCASPPNEDVWPVLSDNDLEVFDPCYKRDRCKSRNDHSELFSLPIGNPVNEAATYLTRADAELKCAIAKEAQGAVSAAICGYRAAVEILITGVKDDPDPARKEAVVRRIAQYLEHAEKLLEGHDSPTHAPDLKGTHLVKTNIEDVSPNSQD